MSNSGIDVEKMDTAYANAASPPPEILVVCYSDQRLPPGLRTRKPTFED